MIDGDETTVVTVVHGDYHAYFAGWIAHLRAAGCRAPVHVIVLDAKEPTFVDPAVTVELVGMSDPAWGDGDYVRLRRVRELCHSGRTCLQVDVDLFFNIDPTVYTRLPQPFIISRGMRFPETAVQAWGFSLCTGF